MIYFLSDAHLGSRVIADRAAHQAKVIALLNQMSEDATAIYLLGDIFDFWFEYFWGHDHSFEPFFDTLRSLTDKGIEVHYFIGNHDIWTFGYIAKRTGAIVHRQPETLMLNGKRCFLAHGDGLGFTHRSFRIIRSIFHNPVAQFFFRLLPPSLGNAFGYNWAKHSREKELARPLGYKGEKNEELIQFAKEMQAKAFAKSQQESKGSINFPPQGGIEGGFDYFIFGHRHIELDLELKGGARVIILGDMFKQWTYAQMDEQGNTTLMNIEE